MKALETTEPITGREILEDLSLVSHEPREELGLGVYETATELPVPYHAWASCLKLTIPDARLDLIKIRQRDDGTFYASVAEGTSVEVVDGGLLVGVCGNGNTAREAVDNFIGQLSGKPLAIVIGAGASVRLTAPQLSSAVFKRPLCRSSN